MHTEKCSVETKVSKVKVSEKGKQAVFLNPKNETFITTKVDGCLIEASTACDWLVTKNNIGSVLVELKGCDVSHALVQVKESLEKLKKKGMLQPKSAALIVCKNPPNHPAFNSKLQRIKQELSKKYRAPLHVISGNYEYEFEKVLLHKSPR